MNSELPVSLLASGGIDSTALIDFYLRRNVEVRCIHFQYGQPSSESEREAVAKVCNYYRVENTIIHMGFPITKRKDEFLGRNALFVLIASSLQLPPTRIALGIHYGSEYYDCTRAFIDDCQHMLDGYFAGTVNLEAPFIDFSKRDIIEYCNINNVPINLTYSCQRQNNTPCGRCNSCRDRQELFGH